MTTNKRLIDNHLVFSLYGELNLYVISEIKRIIQNEIGSPSGLLTLDYANLELIDSSGIGLLIQPQQ